MKAGEISPFLWNFTWIFADRFHLARHGHKPQKMWNKKTFEQQKTKIKVTFIQFIQALILFVIMAFRAIFRTILKIRKNEAEAYERNERRSKTSDETCGKMDIDKA